jgi:copper chaperone CopZ
MKPTHEQGEIRTTILSIDGMSCGACVRHITRALDGMAGVVHAEVDLATNEASVEHLPAFTDAASLMAAIRDAGYTARVTSTRDDAAMETRPGGSVAGCGCGCCGLPGRAEPLTRVTGTIG